MEVLINELLKAGAKRENMEAKVFGGGNVFARLYFDERVNVMLSLCFDYLRMGVCASLPKTQ